MVLEVAHLKSVTMTDDENGDTNKRRRRRVSVPAESFRMKMGEMDVHDRDDSTRSNANPRSRQLSAASSVPHLGSGSRRFSGPIVGLPRTLQHHSGYLGRSAPRHPGLFPGRRKKKKGMAVREPTSPRVSCLGKVRSERDRIGRRAEDGGCSLWSWLFAFSSRGKNKGVEKKDVTKIVGSGVEEKVAPERPGEDERGGAGRTAADDAPAPAPAPEPGGPPGLGALARFSSGRRLDSWASDVERSGPL